MLWDASAINGYAIDASDGRLGTVSDLLFDDADWAIRWLVVDTGDWFPGRKVRVPVSALGQPDPASESFPVRLTKSEIIKSADAPEGQQEAEYPGLRGIASIIGSHVHALDGDAGHVENFLLDASNWTIRCLTIRTRNVRPDESVLISPRSVRNILWSESRIDVDVTGEKINNSPRYHPGDTVDGAFEEKFLTYYGIRWIERADTTLPTATPAPSNAPPAA